MSKQTFIEKTFGDESDREVLRKPDYPLVHSGRSGYGHMQNMKSCNCCGSNVISGTKNSRFHVSVAEIQVTSDKVDNIYYCSLSSEIQKIHAYSCSVSSWYNQKKDFVLNDSSVVTLRKNSICPALSVLFCSGSTQDFFIVTKGWKVPFYPIGSFFVIDSVLENRDRLHGISNELDFLIQPGQPSVSYHKVNKKKAKA